MTQPATPRTELKVFYALVLALALYGQSTGASSWLVPDHAGTLQKTLLWVLVLAFVAVLELGGVVLLRRAEAQRRGGQRAAVAILTAIAIALGASGLSWIGHWSPALADQIQAWAFAGSTLLGVVVWAIMADLSIDPLVDRYRAVRVAIVRYVKGLPMDAAEKAVLTATLDIPFITRYITEGPGAVEGVRAHPRNARIAQILAEVIDPEAWHKTEKPKPVVVPDAPRPVPSRRRAQHVKRTGGRSGIVLAGDTAPTDLTPASGRGPEWPDLDVAKRAEIVWGECATAPSAQQFADAVGCAKSTANTWIQKTLREANGR